MRTTSELDSGFTADRATGSLRCSVASSEDQSVSVASLGRGSGSSDLERLGQRPVSKARPSARGGGEPERASDTDWFFRAVSEWRSICGVSEGARSPGGISATERELSMLTQSMEGELTANVAVNRNRLGGRYASSITYRPASGLSANRPADIQAAADVNPPPHATAAETITSASSHVHFRSSVPSMPAGRWAGGSGGYASVTTGTPA